MTPYGRRSPPPRRILVHSTLALVLLLAAAPLLANGGTVRVSRAPVGPYFVSIFSSPTPLRTGEVDVSVLVQDSADAALDLPVYVEAHPVGFDAEPVRQPATRQQATNKLFKAAKFDVTTPGEWEFRVGIGPTGERAAVSFQATLTDPTLLDRPYLLALLVLLPLALLARLLLGRDDEDDAREDQTGGDPRAGRLASRARAGS